MRIVVGSIMHESNTFTPYPTSLEEFRPRYGDVILQEPGLGSLGGIIARLRAQASQVIPTVSAHALPGGVVARQAYETMKQALVEGIGAAGAVDGVCLALHGSMQVDEVGDAEGELLGSVRAMIGPDVPIVAALDLHANVTVAMVQHADGLVAYRTAPHVDGYNTGERAADLLLQILRTGRRPSMAFAKLPFLLSGEQSETGGDPMAFMIQLLRDADSQPAVLSSSYGLGFPWADVRDNGVSAVVVTAGDSALAQSEANRLAQAFWECRTEFDFQVEAYPIDRAIDAALAAPEATVYLSDSGDNPTAGGTTDIPLVVERLLAKRVPDAVVAAICDPAAVDSCIAAGLGQPVMLSIGGKMDKRHGHPLEVTGEVRLLCDDDRGPTAVLRVDGVDVVLSSERVAVTEPELLRRWGIEPLGRRMVVLKIGYLFAPFQDIAPRSILMLSPGCTNCDLTQLQYDRIRRPVYPLDPDTSWEPSVQDRSRFPSKDAP
jgi:microcystin degradation protein MlrC